MGTLVGRAGSIDFIGRAYADGVAGVVHLCEARCERLENFRLRVFRAVAEEMSFRKAAEVLHLSQPAVSQHIRALEEETGVRLFDRARGEGHGSQISLTEAGRVLLGYANTAAETMVEAQRAQMKPSGQRQAARYCSQASSVAKSLWNCRRVSTRSLRKITL